MWKTEASVEIKAPVESVYKRLAEFTRHSDFSDGLATVEPISPGQTGVGARFQATETVPARYVSFCEITALDESSRIAWKAWVPRTMRTRWELRLTPTAAGTRLVQTSEWEPAGPVGFLMLHVHRKRNAPRENQRTLARIKEMLEAEVGLQSESRPPT
jgi:hypothetical protein